jgi:hypothetical protein
LEEQKPVWTTSSFLLYAGGLTILTAALAALGYLSGQYGDAAYAGWAALVLVVLYGLADRLRRRGRRTAAGVLAFASVIAWAAFVGALWTWFGWLHPSASTSGSPFHGFSVARLSLELLVIAAARDDRRRFGFPLIRVVSAVLGWVFVTDLISNGGDWSAVVTLLIGLAYLAGASGSDEPSAFWTHLVGGVLIGGALLYWWHTTDWQWALICLAALAYVGIAQSTDRSSWAVLATVGLLAASVHFAVEWTHVNFHLTNLLGGGSVVGGRFWVPSLVLAFTGFLLVALGLRGRRRAP